MANTIKLRRGNASQWTSANSLLAEGEIGIELDTGKFKIGNGSASWNSLAYAALEPASASGEYLLLAVASATYATIESPTFTGVPLAPTAASGTSTTQIATTQFVRTEITGLIDGAPALLDTLNELAAALGDDENFAATTASALSEKLNAAVASATYFPISASVTNFGTVVTPSGTAQSNLITDTLTFTESNGILISATASVNSIDFSTNATELDTAGTIVERGSDQSFDISRIDFNVSASIGSGINPGELIWNNEEGTLDLGMSGSVTQSIGMEFYMPPTKNNSGVEIPNGAFVMATGAQGDRITIAKAVTNGTIDPEYMIGVATDIIPINSESGLVTTNGIVRDINTASYTVGTLLYPDPSTAGGLTDVEPTAPNIRTPIAIVLRQHENTGRIYVRMVNSHLLDEVHNVRIISESDNDIISYNSASSLWINQNLASAIQEVDGAGSGIDADLLDGQEGSYYLAAGTASTIYATIDSSSLTGIPTAPTASAGTNTTQIATTEFVTTAVLDAQSGSVDLSAYLTQAAASATYLPISASATLSPIGYLTASAAADIYLRQDTASATYATSLSELDDVDVSSVVAGEFLKYDGATWISASVAATGGGTEEVFYSADPPGAPAVGDIWVESDVDVSIQTYHAAYSASAPSNPIVGDLWVDADETINVIPTNIDGGTPVSVYNSIPSLDAGGA